MKIIDKVPHFFIKKLHAPLKGGACEREGDSKSAFVWHCGQLLSGIVVIKGYFKFEHVVSLITIYFHLPLATASLIGDVMMNRRSGLKMFLSVITAPLVWAQLIDFLIGLCHVNPPMFE
jgi:hypothetical protein